MRILCEGSGRLVTCRFLGPTSRTFDTGGLGWGPKSARLTSDEVLLVQGPHSRTPGGSPSGSEVQTHLIKATGLFTALRSFLVPEIELHCFCAEALSIFLEAGKFIWRQLGHQTMAFCSGYSCLVPPTYTRRVSHNPLCTGHLQ